MILDTIIEFSSEKDLYKNCWLTKLPKDYIAPTEDEKKWLWKFVARQNYYQNLSDLEKQNLQKITEKIENTVPMITSNGSVLGVYHRLYLSYSIGKMFIYNEVVSLNIISSIVIYPTFKLRKVLNESGLVVCQGVNMLLKPIHTIYNLIDLLNETYKTPEASLILMLSEFNETFIKKTHNNWIDDLKYIEAIINKQQTHFQDRIAQKTKELKQKIEVFITEVLPKILETDHRLKSVTDVVTVGCNQIKNQLNILNKFLPMLKDPNQVSLHLSWQSIIKDFQNDTDLIVHEMAHVIDFTNGGLNGVPSVSRKFSEIWTTAFEQEKQKQSLLNPYAFKNVLEFFAVCNETFFKDPELLQQQLPTIHDSLIRIYGYTPKKNKKANTLEYAKLAFFSKMSVLKI
ncbi:zinc-dependent peptidase [Oceanihabitans sp. IOP_32]|uniref:zinc-dependent peptidase n=1 Tax=Oceanihabitans sp. IOP_32 TaxID=2529032 RepID=UPI001293648F|nr:zinc-dependent peptidase [Oceanihabitans sp. IOP_32]QFZ55501.1 zinc-dependent peptidase [Oceanihabitans sp. IOP_32]